VTLKMIKWFLDIFVSAVGLLFLSPFMIVAALMVRVILGSPVLYKQVRPGLFGKPFTIYKFRTMTDKKDTHGNLLPDNERMSSLGLYLRAISLDELPELFNVIKGDMSIVGPRPLLMQYLDRYTPEQARRHDVKPGLTGWAQINGRNAVSWEEKFKLDVWYVDNRSLWLDIQIILKTVVKVLKREGVSGEGQATMSEFMGHEKVQTR